MNRFPEVEKIKNALPLLKESYKEFELATACIAGFPSETENEFKDTLDFIIKSQINMGLLISMSIKPGTKAEDIKPKISSIEISKRIEFAKDYFKNHEYNTLDTEDGGIIFGIK